MGDTITAKSVQIFTDPSKTIKEYPKTLAKNVYRDKDGTLTRLDSELDTINNNLTEIKGKVANMKPTVTRYSKSVSIVGSGKNSSITFSFAEVDLAHTQFELEEVYMYLQTNKEYRPQSSGEYTLALKEVTKSSATVIARNYINQTVDFYCTLRITEWK